MTLSKTQLIAGNSAILAAQLEGLAIATAGIPLVWIFESANTPTTGVQLTGAISENGEYTLICRSLILSVAATATIEANGGVWATFTGRSFDFGANGLYLNPLNSLKVTHTSPTPIPLITLFATPVLVAKRQTWI